MNPTWKSLGRVISHLIFLHPMRVQRRVMPVTFAVLSFRCHSSQSLYFQIYYIFFLYMWSLEILTFGLETSPPILLYYLFTCMWICFPIGTFRPKMLRVCFMFPCSCWYLCQSSIYHTTVQFSIYLFTSSTKVGCFVKPEKLLYSPLYVQCPSQCLAHY
jgi:hypothetical protein